MSKRGYIAERDPISPNEWRDGHSHRREGRFCTSCGSTDFLGRHHALIPLPRDTPIYDRLMRAIPERG